MPHSDGDVRLSTVIMTHPARAARAQALAEQLAALSPVLVVDTGPAGRGNLGNAVRAWAAVGADATHHLVLQDDVIPCGGFAEQLHRAVRARPDDAVSLFCEWGSRTAGLVRAAAWQGWSWARAVDVYTPSQGLVLPRRAALDFAASVTDPTGADDLALSAHLRATGRRTVVTVPNLVEHDDHLSLTGNGFQGLRHAACPAADGAPVDFGTAVAGEGLTWVPWASWMRVHAEWFFCGDQGELTWLGEFADTRLPDGLRKADLSDRFYADLAAADPALPAAVSELTLFEYWTTYFALGLTMPGSTRAEPGPLATGAFATAFAGLFRRYLPMPTVAALQAPAGQFAAAAFRRGADADLDRPHAGWYAG
ncbi:hypothetical protein [Catellatospora chokoriensis]|uniref:Uncharacterized protein n=1 Tax=Catellatospora chokoriensis TaxID=310353 RepID=A0A8J3JXG2_9ACTN|nr:hypothetical protein [Catellatospora chokoriensis]GIF92942.1 hypothetical protein Cch02nite_63860 [Catellatospora chokoriensis]